MHENVLRYSGDCLVDLSRKYPSEKGQELLERACIKYEESLSINPQYFMAHYYYGRTLHLLANARKGTPLADETFEKAIEKFKQARLIKADDVYLIYEDASVLQDFALTKSGREAEELFNRAAERVSRSTSL